MLIVSRRFNSARKRGERGMHLLGDSQVEPELPPRSEPRLSRFSSCCQYLSHSRHLILTPFEKSFDISFEAYRLHAPSVMHFAYSEIEAAHEERGV